MQKTTAQLQSERMELFAWHKRATKRLLELDIEIAKRIKHETRALTARSYVN